MNSKAVNKYLELYSEKEVLELGNCIDRFSKSYSNALLIPAYIEPSEFLSHLEVNPPLSKGRILLVLVSNHPAELSQLDQTKAITAHLELVKTLGSETWSKSCLTFYEKQNIDVLVVNRIKEDALPIKQGVGLARKIGADLIAFLITKGIITSDWIMSTDADVRLPKNYFQIRPLEQDSAIVYNFEHSNINNKVSQATQLYEKSIRHYVSGLKYAKSNYAFSTLGSCLAVKLSSYAKVRGFPKRAAGEDFYLLNKLAKIGSINTENTPTISIESRISNRVPFGTGPAVEKIINNSDAQCLALFYEPEVFEQLKLVLQILWEGPNVLTSAVIPRRTKDALVFLGIDDAFKHADKQNLKIEQYRQHITSWFDGFKTLKFVHYLRDNGYPMLTESQLNEGTFF